MDAERRCIFHINLAFISRLVQVEGIMPSARGAHASACVNGRLAMFGGTDGSVLAPSELFVLDHTANPWRWLLVAVKGPSPPARYGHSLSVKTPFLVKSKEADQKLLKIFDIRFSLGAVVPGLRTFMGTFGC